ncbi:hypothetical protein CPLU01_14228 [Colletotrichum plurivorum]|uniref:Ubiquitin-like domain-containing protein n=1 Tax=Colletotrichum plurivorum TaxID=2175906 RepID=A0A8H6JKV2_9PEZI|nr:hypothetical protein CPLU01_14228 [Colletotrichum plurivorum]
MSSDDANDDGGAKKEKMETIRFKDAIGRKFRFPFEMVKTWSGMEDLIKQAFLHVDVLGPHVQEGHYDLIGPEGEIILPQLWNYFVRPDWNVEMKMWPLEAPPQPPQWPPPPPGPPPGMPRSRPEVPPPGTRPLQSDARPPPPPGLANWPPSSSPNVPANGPQTASAPIFVGEPPPPPRAEELVNLKPPRREKKKDKRQGQDPFSQWVLKSKKKRGSVAARSDYEAPIGRHVVPEISMGERGARRWNLANEKVINPSAPRNIGDRSFNLRPKKKHAKSRSVPSSSSSSSSSTSSSGRSAAASIRTMTKGDARRLISQRRLVVTCAASSRPLRRPTTALNAGNANNISTPPDILELTAAQIHRDGFEKLAFTTLELVKQRPNRGPPSKEQGQTSGSMTWKYDFGADSATRSAVDQLFVSIRKKMLDDEWFIKPGTALRCDTRPGEEAPASVTFVSVPYLYADSFKSTPANYQASENCLPRRLHEALSRLGSAEQDKRQHFRQNEGRSTGQVLWIGQIWILLSASSLLTYGTVAREDLEGDTITIRDLQSSNEKEDRVIRVMDEDRRLFYLPADKCRSFYELETSVRDKMNGEQDMSQCDLTFSLPDDEVLNASRWSSLLKLEEIPTIKVSVSVYSGDESDDRVSVASEKSLKSVKLTKSFGAQGEKADSEISLELDANAESPKAGEVGPMPEDGVVQRGGPRSNRSRQKFVDFTSVEDVASSGFFEVAQFPETTTNRACAGVPHDVPQLNNKVPPFFDWKPSTAEADAASDPADRFRKMLDKVEEDLLQRYKYDRSKTNLAIGKAYEAFGSNVYEEAMQQSFADFSHIRQSQSKDGTDLAGTPRAKLNTLAEDLYSVSVPALEAFVLSEFKSSLTLKYFGSLSKVLADPTSSRLLWQPDDTTKPHRFVSSEDKLKQRWVVSRDLIKQADLRFVFSQDNSQAQCPDCERGKIYASPEKGVSHLRKMHLATSKTDRVLRDYLIPLSAALVERLDEEVRELLVAARNMLASTLRKLAAIQSGVMDGESFRGSERGIPYYLVDAFKLIVVLVCALPLALHELRWFYRDFDHNAQSLTSQRARSHRAAMDGLGELAGELIRKAERTLVSPTGSAKENDAEHFATSVGLNYLSLQIMLNLLQRPVHNRKKPPELYTAYARDLGTDVQRKPSKRQIPRIGALTSELNLLKDAVELQKDCIDSVNALALPETLHPSLAKALDRHALFWIESDLLSELGKAARKEDEDLDGVLELCVQLKGLVSELTEIMADDQGRAVFVFTVVTVTFLPLSFVASYLSMSGGTDGLGMEWGEVQARFWTVAGPLTAVVAAFCFFIAGRGTVARLLSRPTQHVVEDDDDDKGDWSSDTWTTNVTQVSSRRNRGRRRWRWPWSITIRRRGDSTSDEDSDYWR